MTVLVTGGMGYIGSHTCVELLEQGMDVVVIDNLVNSSEKAKERIEEITGKTLSFYKADVRDRKKLDEIFLSHDIDCVIHFAGLKAVGDLVYLIIKLYDFAVYPLNGVVKQLGQRFIFIGFAGRL